MSLKIGIVGLPNVGKSTIFNALTRSQAAKAANFPFCTIDPNKGIVDVPDPRLYQLADIIKPVQVIHNTIEFVDIAGLVKGASQGEGLGNQFLSHIRECDAIAQVIRFFEDSDIIHVHNEIDPKRDIEIIESELILADLQTLGKRIDKVRSQAKSGDKKLAHDLDALTFIENELGKGIRAINIKLTDEQKELIQDLHLLTNKPLLYIANLKEHEISSFNKENIKKHLNIREHEDIIPICAKLEEDLAGFEEEEAKELLSEAGLSQTGLEEVIRSSYKLLNLETFFTAGVKEVRAWTIEKNSKAPQAAGVIHTDFEKGFIKAEVIGFNDYITAGGELKAKEKGLARQEGKEYIVKDGDVMHFKFNV
ncbi:redox-regulated ATPase YchF [Candidatus Peregrinibacteria bacterium RIFOXYC2_FULL_33_13]|nr:MAG: hypothetical protein UR27_C0010G0077 [Candidatus Peregrinibacteria bacterium GW2011_GWA2_33_10]KKP41265.1 MAG: GTP-dependent translational factor YchF [Candidatus Peregrinibacteria bacterium GW2011_GWC2_33_13]OGJ54465.1 MAG: redox-regulated ATPase YchF [Candidatus Peregrinibacteria bacterium RIFOXYC2_FULL_33_13]